MPISLQEGRIQFRFPRGWRVLRPGESAYYRSEAQDFTRDLASRLQFVGISVINAGSCYFRTDAVVEVRESYTEDGDPYLEITLDDGTIYALKCDEDQVRALYAAITAEAEEVPSQPTPII